MPHFKTVPEAQQYNARKRKEREVAASRWPNDKLRVVPMHHQTVMHGRQVLTFRPTDVIDDPIRVKIMDELDVKYRVVSRPPKTKTPDQTPPPATAPKKGTTQLSEPKTSTKAAAPATTEESAAPAASEMGATGSTAAQTGSEEWHPSDAQ